MVDDQVLEALSQGCEFARPINMLGAGGVHLPGGPAWWSGDEGFVSGRIVVLPNGKGGVGAAG